MSNSIVLSTDSRQELKEVLTPVAKLGLSFDSLMSLAESIQDSCMDFNVSGDNPKFFDGDSGRLVFIPDGDKRAMKFFMSRFALSQLCSKLGVPVRYMEKCIENGMSDLAADNINAWFQDFNKNLFIRCHEGRIRGILSDRYMALDTPEILEVLSDVIDPSQYSTKGFFLSPERFHARIVQNNMMKVEGEDLFAGVQVDSSDVGRSTLSVRFFIFKQVCTNGLCISKGGGVLFEQRHVGISLDDFRKEFKESIHRIPDLVANAQEMIKVCQSDKIQLLSEKEMQDFTNHLKLTTKLSDDAVGKVINLMQERYSSTRWGLVNSITEVAQDYTLERRVELEKIAGDLLSVKVA